MARIDWRAGNGVSSLQQQYGTIPASPFGPITTGDHEPSPVASTVEAQRFTAMVSAIGHIPMGQKIALLTMLNSEQARDVLAHLKEDKGEKPATAANYDALAFARMAVRPSGKRWYQLTPLGRRRATDVLREQAKAHGLHHFSMLGSGRFDRTLACTCGWNAGMSLNAGHVDEQRGRLIIRHLGEVKRTAGIAS